MKNLIALTVPAVEVWNFTPSSTGLVSLVLVAAGVAEDENRLTGVAAPGAETVRATLADAVPPRSADFSEAASRGSSTIAMRHRLASSEASRGPDDEACASSTRRKFGPMRPGP